MKKSKNILPILYVIIINLIINIFFLQDIKAQNEYVSKNEDIHFGIQAGGSVMTSFTSKGGPWQFDKPYTKVGFSGSAFFEWDFGRKKRWFAHLELGVGSANLKAEGVSSDTAFGKFSLDAKYIDIMPAIGIGYYFIERESPINVYLMACISGSFPEERATPAITINRQDVTAEFGKSFGARLECGVTYSFFCLSLRYDYGFLPIMDIRNQKFRAGHFDFLLKFRFF